MSSFFRLFTATAILLSAATARAELAPLSLAQVRALQGLPADPVPEALTRNSHYWVSNENRLELFQPHIQGRGGVLLGVGTDQNYLFAGWARPEVLILMDFDQAVSDLHEIYGVVFAGAADSAAFLEAWTQPHADELEARLISRFPEPGRQKRILRAVKTARPSVLSRLRKLKRHLAELGVASFLSDAEQYAYVRDLWAKRRVVALRGDLTGAATMRAIGQLLKEQGWTVGVFYPSNAEQYFDFVPQYRDNVRGLPASEKSVVIRTMGWGTIYGQADETYHYNVQPLSNFQTWLQEARIPSCGRMLRWRHPTEVVGFSTFDKLPGAEPTPPISRRKPKP